MFSKFCDDPLQHIRKFLLFKYSSYKETPNLFLSLYLHISVNIMQILFGVEEESFHFWVRGDVKVGVNFLIYFELHEGSPQREHVGFMLDDVESVLFVFLSRYLFTYFKELYESFYKTCNVLFL